MLSKVILTSVLSLALLGCGLKMGEKKIANDVAEVQSAKCLDQSVSEIKLYFKGEATDDQAGHSFQCLQEVFVAFRENIRGENKNVYTPEEIAQFVQRNFIKDSSTFSPAFLSEVMKFKVALIGGDTNVVQKTEITQLVNILARLTPELVRLNKSIKILTFKWDQNLQPADQNEKEAQFLTAQQDFQQVLNTLTAEFIRQGRAYPTNDIVNFAKEVSIFAKLDQSTIDRIGKAQDLVKSVKVALMGGEASLQNQEWLRLATTLNNGLFQLLRYKYFVKDLRVNQKFEAWVQYEKIANGIVELIENVLADKDSQLITSEEVLNLVKGIQAQDWLSQDVKEENVNAVLNGLWMNLLNSPEQRLQGTALPGLNLAAVQQLSKHVLLFVKVQKTVGQIFDTNSTSNQTDLKQALQVAADANGAVDQELQNGLLELIRVINSKVTLTFNTDYFLKILSDDAGTYHYDDLFVSNLARLASHLLIQSYATDLTRVTNLVGLTQAEAEGAFAQFKGLALDLDVVDPKTADTFISSRFREANLFLTSSDGDQFVSLKELHDLILHIVSGLSRAGDGKESIAKACLPGYAGELKSTTAIPEDCLLNFYLTETHMFTDMPQFLNLKSEFSDDQRKEYFMNLLKAAGHIPNADKVVYLGDANLFPHVLQYVEMIYAGYDANRDNRLDKDEALVAYPVFRDTIKLVANVKDEQLQGTFIYLLKNGKPPKTLAEKLAFAAFVSNPEKWIISTTRLDLGKIFNFIAEATAPVPPKPQTPVTPTATPGPAVAPTNAPVADQPVGDNVVANPPKPEVKP